MNKEKQMKILLNVWDLVKLFPLAPIDEYNIEIKNVINQISEQDNISSQTISKIIYLIYNKSFGDVGELGKRKKI